MVADDQQGTGSAPEVVLEAALRPTAAEAYPYLPVAMWTRVERLARLVAWYRGISIDGLENLRGVLSRGDFAFRSRRLSRA